MKNEREQGRGSVHCFLPCPGFCTSCLTYPIAVPSSLVSFPILAHPISGPYCPLFPDKLGSFSLCLPAEFWCCFLACPFSRYSLCHCITFSCRDFPHPSPSVLFQICIFLLFSKWLCLVIFLTATVVLLDTGLSLYLLLSKCLHVCALRCAWASLKEWSWSYFRKISLGIWPRNYLSLPEQDGTASWILSVCWKLGKGEKFAVFLFWCLKSFDFLFVL